MYPTGPRQQWRQLHTARMPCLAFSQASLKCSKSNPWLGLGWAGLGLRGGIGLPPVWVFFFQLHRDREGNGKGAAQQQISALVRSSGGSVYVRTHVHTPTPTPTEEAAAQGSLEMQDPKGAQGIAPFSQPFVFHGKEPSSTYGQDSDIGG